MTEEEWLTSPDPREMWWWQNSGPRLRKSSYRKVRLINAAMHTFSKAETDDHDHADWGVKAAALLRDIMGNPFCPSTPVTPTPTIRSLAEAAYVERNLRSGRLDPERLAVLADALEEVGAADGVVSHLREAGPHVVGCWAVDLCLGMS